jgi:TRAP-type C4-dicarboxylate transport system substrate-binding protein
MIKASSSVGWLAPAAALSSNDRILEEPEGEMSSVNCARHLRGGAAAALWLAMMLAGAQAAEEKTYPMKFTFPTINDSLHQLAKSYAAAVEKDSGGRIKPEIYPASQLGSIPRQIEGVQFGAIQCAIVPPEFFVGVDERFELMTAPGLVTSMEHGQRLAADPAVLKLMLGLGANKGLRGVGLFNITPSSIIAKNAIRHLSDFKGKKIRIFASDFQTTAFKRLGVTPVAMTLGDVLPAIQQGAIDGALAAITVYATMQYQDAAKYVTETGQPTIFGVIEISRKWYESLPADLQQIVDRDGAAAATEINSFTIAFNARVRQMWLDKGGELISLPGDEQSAMMETLASVGEDVSKSKPQLSAGYELVTEAAKRTR